MKDFNVAILGCGTVGSGVAKILLDMSDELNSRANANIKLTKIVDLFPQKSAKTYDLPIALFCGSGNDLTREESTKYINEVIHDKNIHLVVETIGGTSDFLTNIIIDALKAKKHVVTANKAILAEKGKAIFEAAKDRAGAAATGGPRESRQGFDPPPQG